MAIYSVRFQMRPDVPTVPMLLDTAEEMVYLIIDADASEVTQGLARRYLMDLHIMLFRSHVVHDIQDREDSFRLHYIDTIAMTPRVARRYLYPYLPDLRDAPPAPGVH